MSHIADDQQIASVSLDETNNAGHRMAGDNVGLNLDVRQLGFRGGLIDDSAEYLIFAPGLLDYFIDRCWKIRQFLNHDHVQRATASSLAPETDNYLEQKAANYL
jgi:hypothetical protein